MAITSIQNGRKVTVTIEGMGTYTVVGSIDVNIKQLFDPMMDFGMVKEMVYRGQEMHLRIEGLAFPETYNSAINAESIKLEPKPDQRKVCRLILVED